MQEQLFRVRDRRDKGWFWVDNDYLNGYARFFGGIGTSVYLALCRHAHIKDQVCFPSQRTIAEELGIGERTVRDYIKQLEKYKFIKVERPKDPRTKKRLANTYILLDKSEWVKPKARVASGSGARVASTHRQGLPPKETNVKETNFKERYKKLKTNSFSFKGVSKREHLRR